MSTSPSPNIGRLAGIGQGQDHVGGRDQTQVAMHGLDRVQKDGGRAGGVQGGRDLLPYQPGLADARDHQLAL